MADKKTVSSIEELRALDEKGLQSKLAELRQTSVEQYRANAAQELPSSAVIRKTRREIATALTILGEVQRAGKQKEQEK